MHRPARSTVTVLLLVAGVIAGAGRQAAAGGGDGDWHMSADLPAFNAVAITVRSDSRASPPAARMALQDEAGRSVYRFAPLPGTGVYAYFQTRDMALADIDQDGMDDVVVVIEAMTGIGPSGAEPFPLTGVYLRRSDGFERSVELEERLTSAAAHEGWGDLQSLLDDVAKVPDFPD
jgi:hypothetical protein